MSYDAVRLYKDTYTRIPFEWDNWLHEDIIQFHKWFCVKYNSPVELQMGILLPFISACLGPTTTGLWLTDPGVLNLFWMNIASSGTGKSMARTKLIAEPLEFMAAHHGDEIFPDFEVSRFTRAGM